ncbi:MAG: AraC family transcriptional regulator [Muribaculaceae bacterium]|nr:AraC family transcriptional regulator [Muribaculaceae bacterium]
MPQLIGQSSTRATLAYSRLAEWRDEPQVIDQGIIMLCRYGSSRIRVDFVDWQLPTGAVITLFPGDVVWLHDTSADFEVELLRFDKELLREASVQLEQTVYSLLRADRCRNDCPIVTTIIDNMFSLLKVYFSQHDCICLDQLVLYQLKAFFLGFYDWIYRNRREQPALEGSQLIHDRFYDLMVALETNFMRSREVAFYASQLSLSTKYLNSIVRRITGETAKTIIDRYVVMQLKLRLRDSGESINQIAWDYNFSDTSFFCRYFKRHTGVSPMQFRALSREQ